MNWIVDPNFWPAALRGATLRQFRTTGRIERAIGILADRDDVPRLRLLQRALESTEFETLPLLALGGDPRVVEIALRRRGTLPASADHELALAMGALSRRLWTDAARHYREAARLGARYAGAPNTSPCTPTAAPLKTPRSTRCTPNCSLPSGPSAFRAS